MLVQHFVCKFEERNPMSFEFKIKKIQLPTEEIPNGLASGAIMEVNNRAKVGGDTSMDRVDFTGDGLHDLLKIESMGIREGSLARFVSSSQLVTKSETTITKNTLLGKDSEYVQFLVVDPQTDIALHPTVMKKWKEMQEAAKQDGVALYLHSGYRSFDEQANGGSEGWNNKYARSSYRQTKPNSEARALAMFQYNALPGTSRHHWGTDLDLGGPDRKEVADDFYNGNQKAQYEWLQNNAARFGFYQPYIENLVATADFGPGYNSEPWHWTYLPLAEEFLKQFEAQITRDVLERELSSLQGSQYIRYEDILGRIFNINPECL